MNGVHDMGGLQGFGALPLEADEPLFHTPWERRALGLTLAMGASGLWNIDLSRATRESLPPDQYLTLGYYGIWIAALERLLLRAGVVGADELQAGRSLAPPRPLPRVIKAEQIDAALARGSPTLRPGAEPARFAVGDLVRARNLNPPSHTRLPRYVRGRVGTVVRVHGTHVFPDRHAVGDPGPPFDDSPEWLYSVEFEAAELWGPQAEAGVRVSVDAWEPYLEPAGP
jgi:nitrile hydratase